MSLPAPAAPPPPVPPTPPPPPPPQILAPPVLVAMPANFTVSAGDGSVKVLWDLVNGAQSYRIDWVSDPDLLGVEPDGTVRHEGLTNGLRYVYTVATGTQQVVLSAVPTAADATAPSQVSISAGLRDATITWSAVAGATGYRLYWSYLPNVTPATGTSVAIASRQTTYLHSDLDPGATYYYVVTAILSDGTQGLPSAEVGARPGQTTPVTVTAFDGRVELTLPSTVSGPVEASTSRTFDVPFLPFPPDLDGEPTPITLNDLANGTRYAFRVRPVFTDGAGPSSAAVYATPSAAASGVPQAVTLTAGRGVNTLSWTPVTNASTYDVTWTVVYENGTADSGTVTVDEPVFRHSQLQVCSTLGSTCPTYAYLVRVAASAAIGPIVEAVSLDLRPVPPLVTNTDFLILAGVKPSGSRVEISKEVPTGTAPVVTVPFDRDTGWTAKVPLDTDGPSVFRLVAIDDTGLSSTVTVYQVTRDTQAPTEPTVQTVACDPATASPREITLSGGKDSGGAVFRLLEPNAPDQQIAGATAGTSWSGVIQVDGATSQISVMTKDAAGNASSPLTVYLATTPSPPSGAPHCP